MKKIFFLLVVFFAAVPAFALPGNPEAKIDSLKKIIASHVSDSIKIKAYFQWDDMIYQSDQALDLKINREVEKICRENIPKRPGNYFEKQLSFALNNLGNYYVNHGEYAEALKNFNESLRIKIRMNDEGGISNVYINMGLVYDLQGNYPEAMESYYAALKIKESLRDTSGIAYIHNNIGIICENQENFEEALEHHKTALKLFRQTGDMHGEASSSGNMGIIYKKTGDFSNALKYYYASLEIFKETNNIQKTASIYHNIATVLMLQGDSAKRAGSPGYASEKYALAKENYVLSLDLKEKFVDQHGIAVTLINLGGLYMRLENYSKARNYMNEGLSLSFKTGNKEDIKTGYSTLATLDSLSKNYKNAYFNFYFYTLYRDSLINEEKTKKILGQKMQYDFEKKEALIAAEHEKEMEIAEKDKKQQETIIWFIAGALLMVVAFSLFVLKSLRQTKKQKITIEEQKLLVEEKQKEIIDSITYAKRLQRAILAPETEIKKYFPDSFLLYMPKDIVAGDFYFFEVTDTHIFYAAADCTGHGVPGAMVSVVCSNALTRCVKEFGLTQPGEILDKARDLILETFQKSNEDVKDGMDISLISINQKTNEIKWAGANNPLWIIEGKSHEAKAMRKEMVDGSENISLMAHGSLPLALKEHKADKQPIGKTDNPKPFTTHVIAAKKGDLLFLFTDGFADQFGGSKGKKLKYRELEKLLCSVYGLPSAQQKSALENAFNEWKGNYEQVDDVCMMGIII